ncbi:MAG: hypothetical protein PHU25_05455 [Deltaproteobacteria bacterium]|nr:hypothetical protein [Deltaproteobacteria bacterium]
MVIVTVIRLISVPLFLVNWGKDLYGEWLIVTTLLTYFDMSNLGFAQTAANDMTIAVAKGDRESALRVYQSTAVFLFVVILMVFAIALTLPPLLPLGRWMNLSLIGAADLRLIIIMLAGSMALSFFMWLLMAGYRCEGKYHRGLLFVNLFVIIDFAGTVAFLITGFGTVYVALAMFVARTLVCTIMVLDIKRVAPWIKLGYSNASRREIRRMLSPSLSFMSYPVSMAVINQGAVLAIGTIVNPAAVVLFTAMRTLTNMVLRVFELVNQAIYPEISMAWGVGNNELLKRLHRTSCQASLWIGAAAIAFLAVLGRWIFEAWTGGKVEFDATLLYGLLAIMAVRAVWQTSMVLPSAINRHQRIAVSYLVLSMLGLAGFVTLLKMIDLHWALLALGALEVAMIAVVLPTSLKLSSDKLSVFTCQVLQPPNPVAVARMFLKKIPDAA